jgi:hypothetical protein
MRSAFLTEPQDHSLLLLGPEFHSFPHRWGECKSPVAAPAPNALWHRPCLITSPAFVLNVLCERILLLDEKKDILLRRTRRVVVFGLTVLRLTAWTQINWLSFLGQEVSSVVIW